MSIELVMKAVEGIENNIKAMSEKAEAEFKARGNVDTSRCSCSRSRATSSSATS